jgi:hypothetical protein
MHDVLRERLWRHIEALPDEQVYQVLDYIEFLASKYNRGAVRSASSLQKFSERLEDKMRSNRVGFGAIRGTLDAVGAADRMVSGLTEAGRSLFREVEEGLKDSPRRELPPRDPSKDKPERPSPRRDIPVDG